MFIGSNDMNVILQLSYLTSWWQKSSLLKE